MRRRPAVRHSPCQRRRAARNFKVAIKPMSVLIADCPRCGSKSITFDVCAQVFRFQESQWKNWYEVFSVCRSCHTQTIFMISLRDYSHAQLSKPNASLVEYKNSLNEYFEIDRYISLRDHAQHQPPEFLDDNLSDAFKEGAACFSIACYNAAATMFRLCVDLVTRPLLPDPSDTTVNQSNEKTRRDLGLRLPWMFDNKLIGPCSA